MLYEIDALNIKATLVEPGLARRDEYVWGHILLDKGRHVVNAAF